jgi:hypothetical protein
MVSGQMSTGMRAYGMPMDGVEQRDGNVPAEAKRRFCETLTFTGTGHSIRMKALRNIYSTSNAFHSAKRGQRLYETIWLGPFQQVRELMPQL